MQHRHPPRATLVVAALVGSGVGLFHDSAQAQPTAPQVFCDYYDDVPECTGTLITCETCHTSTDPATWNPFGAQLAPHTQGQVFEDALFGALQSVEELDADADGVSNLEEIVLGTKPGDARSVWFPYEDPEGDNPRWLLGEWDPEFAYRRAMVKYCGRSPSYDEMQELGGLEDVAAKRDALHIALDDCLAGDWWKQVGVRELADPKIRPVKAVGAETEVYFGSIRLVLGDYEWDYRLWRYLMTDGRDMRELLTAQYHVEEDENGVLTPVDGFIPAPEGLVAGGQPLAEEHRAGMLTTQWFIMANTMFSPLPRTTAAQAYRAYLGADLSKQEGIRPVAGEPSDIDNKGVKDPTCAGCHSTLDPLSYAFAYYTGIQPPVIGVYDKDRPFKMIEDWDADAVKSEVLGVEVETLVEWAAVAAESIQFQRAMADMLFQHAVGHEPSPADAIPFEELWTSMPDDGYSANALIHRIVDTEAFGAP